MSATKSVASELNQTQLIPLTQLVPAERFRGRSQEVNPKKVDRLAESLKKEGQISPILAVKTEDEKYEVVVGFTRLAAFRKLAETGQNKSPLVNVTVIDGSDAESIVRKNIAENLIREQTNPVDNLDNQEYLRTNFGYTDAQISRMYDVSKADISRFHKLSDFWKGWDELKEYVREEKIPLYGAIFLAEIGDVEKAKMVLSLAEEKKDHSEDSLTAKNKELRLQVKQNNKLISIRDLREAYNEILENESDIITDGSSSPESDGSEGGGQDSSGNSSPERKSIAKNKKEILEFLSSESTRGLRVKESMEGPYNRAREVMFGMILQWIDGSKTSHELNEHLDSLFPHSDHDFAHLLEYWPDPSTPDDENADEEVPFDETLPDGGKAS